MLAAPDGAITCGTFHSVFAPGPGLDTVGWMMRRAIGRIDGKIVVSEACIGSLSRYFPYEYTVIPNGIDDRHFTPDADPVPELTDGRRNILFLGRFDPRNGLGTMIDAFGRVRREYGPEVRLVVVGDGPLRSFYQKRVPREIVDDVVWAGRVNWRRPNYYTAADIHCTPCSRASFGMVLLEAMSCGRPVVASRISGFQLVMEHGRHGLMISPADDADRFAEGAAVPARPPGRARAHGTRGTADGRHDVLLDEDRTAARGLLCRAPAGRGAGGYFVTKRQVLTRYVLLAVLAAVVVGGHGSDARRARLRLAGMAARRRLRGCARAAHVGRVRRQLAAVRASGQRGDVTEPVVAITFDDGPSPDTTPKVLDALRMDGARATFFVLGKHAERYPEVVERIVREGHEVASHGYDHSILTFASRREITRQLQRTDVVLRASARLRYACSARRTASATRW